VKTPPFLLLLLVVGCGPVDRIAENPASDGGGDSQQPDDVLVTGQATSSGAASSSSEKPRPVTVDIPLTDGRYYLESDLVVALQAKLGGGGRQGTMRDARHEWLPAYGGLNMLREAILRKRGITDFIQIRKEKDRIRLVIPDAENDAVRHRRRRDIGRLLKVDLLAWPPGSGLVSPKGFRADRPTVVLIHGIEAGATDLALLESACEKSSRQVLRFIYPNDGPIEWSGKRLSADLKSLAKKHPEFRCQVIAHSMGGLVARYCLESAECFPGPIVTDVVSLGTPHHGSRLASGQGLVELIYQHVLPVPDPRWTANNDGIGEAALDLMPNSKFLRRLNKCPPAPGVRYHVAAGDAGPLSDTAVNWSKRKLETLVKTGKLPANRLAILLEMIEADELRRGRGDGAVSLRSAKLRDVQTQVFDVNHLQIHRPPAQDPVNDPVFQWITEVLKW
jgi:pimeloyl-ACP methyl ester carboxylesterase